MLLVSVDLIFVSFFLLFRCAFDFYDERGLNTKQQNTTTIDDHDRCILSSFPISDTHFLHWRMCAGSCQVYLHTMMRVHCILPSFRSIPSCFTLALGCLDRNQARSTISLGVSDLWNDTSIYPIASIFCLRVTMAYFVNCVCSFIFNRDSVGRFYASQRYIPGHPLLTTDFTTVESTSTKQ